MYFLQCAFDLKKTFSVCHVFLVLTIQYSTKRITTLLTKLEGQYCLHVHVFYSDVCGV